MTSKRKPVKEEMARINRKLQDMRNRFGMREDKFILNGKRPEVCADIFKWGEWFEKSSRDGTRHVAKTTIGECWISTVFLGLDHGFGRSKAPPILFETMAFGPPIEEYSKLFKRNHKYRPEICSMERYATWEEAESGHARICAEVRELLKNNAADAAKVLRRIGEKAKQ